MCEGVALPVSWQTIAAVAAGFHLLVVLSFGWRYFGYQPAGCETDADMGRRHTTVFPGVLRDKGFAQPNPRPMFPDPPRHCWLLKRTFEPCQLFDPMRTCGCAWRCQCLWSLTLRAFAVA